MKTARSYLRLIGSALLLVAVLAVDLSAATGIGIGLKAGIVTDFDNPNIKLSEFEFDDLAYYGGFLKWGGRLFDLEIGAEYYWDSQDLELFGETKEVEVKDFFIGATAKYFFDFPLVKPFVGGGLAVHNFTYKYNGPLGQFDEVTLEVPDDEAYFGFHLVVGAKLTAAVLPFDLFIEGKMGKVNTDPDATDFTVISGGLIFNLP